MKPGEKYIIEIDHTTKTADGERAYIKGFRTLVFDQYGLDKLRHAEEIGDAYRRGFDDARKTSPDALPNDVIDSAYKRGWNDAMGRFPKSAEERHEIYQRGWNECAEKIQNIKDAAYQDGLDDAWSMARQMYSEMTIGTLRQIFNMQEEDNTCIVMEILNAFPAAEVKKRLDAYEKEKEQKEKETIVPGDEVKYRLSDTTFIVTKVDGEFISGFGKDGGTFCDKRSCNWGKTGRHFDLNKLFQFMGGGDGA